MNLKVLHTDFYINVVHFYIILVHYFYLQLKMDEFNKGICKFFFLTVNVQLNNYSNNHFNGFSEWILDKTSLNSSLYGQLLHILKIR